MNYLLTFLSGIIITIMTSFNGQLSSWCGTYLATLIIHLIGLITFIIFLKIKNISIDFNQQLPLLLYCGGVIGILTVIFNVISVNRLGVALITALSLSGQMITSIIIEQTGWFASVKRKLTFKKACSLLIVFLGIGVMLL